MGSMHIRPHVKALYLLLVLALLTAGCAGSVHNQTDDSEQEEMEEIGFTHQDTLLSANDGGAADSVPSMDGVPVVNDQGTLPDSSAPQQDTAPPAPDTTPPPPDTTPPPPDTTPPAPDTMPPTPDAFVPNLGGPGDPCPCGGATLCFDGVCRPLCDAPTDPCQAASNCPADHACVGLINSTANVCLPAVAPGQACGQDAFCPVNHVCGSINNSPYICLPTCAGEGSPCGSGGICLQSQSGCFFCSVPS
jgi:hypothetical protein